LGEKKGFTQTHQVVVDFERPGAGHEAAAKLEEVNIILNKNIIPGLNQSPKMPRGIRIGVQEMTRFGMKEGEMKEIARLIKEAMRDERGLEEIKKDVIGLRSGFQIVRYCFNEE
ncbi:MAG: serine hydroxymethyltransferase, partial [Candidatus Nealsonbacteria bacterium]|nr:serine hydroxymethyltransferase [Candidatus Nealsonbacteria bacterium]